MASHTFIHSHSSGRFDRPEGAILRQYQSLEELGSSIITGTECAGRSHKNALKKMTAYGMFIKDVDYSDDCVVLWKKDEWKPVYQEAFRMTRYRYYNTKGILRKPPSAKIVVLESLTTKRRILVTVAHLASHVQDGGRFYRSRRVVAWFDSVRNWKKRRNIVYAKFSCSSMLVAADWNVDLKRRFFRLTVKGLQRGMRYVWDLRNMPSGGTLGSRLIDFSMIRGNIGIVRRPRILLKTNASDHRPYKETLRIY